jgi:hypothetical protein
VSGGRCRADGGSAPGLVADGAAFGDARDRGPSADGQRGMIAPRLYLYGDDDLAAARRIERFGAELAQAGGGEALERMDVTGRLDSAGEQTARLAERLLTPVMFGGGTLAIVRNPGALTRSTEYRERLLRAIEHLAPGNAVVIVEATTQANP